ncbi:probable chitinase 2 [Lepeophtheirus salmonis]|uniref:chitinase n=1 Tax=Lepeophtheirus salmonis TaxID=72036 RepID=A0A0K2TAM7_LEPSM|nr:probable chitinase 2 [Lepeophtheirus salmonis]
MSVGGRAVNFLLLLSSVAFVRTEREMEEKQFNVDGHNKVVVCYWGTWSNYRPKDGAFKPEDIDASLCTHLIYSFAGLDETESKIKSLDPWMDLEENYGLAGYRKVTDLKYSRPDLKVSIAIGGWNEGSKKYSAMARDAEKRALFVESVVNFLNKYNFDGLDIDWEYPAKRGGVPDDKKNFILLIQELHVAFKKHNFLLTAAIGAAPSTIDKAYDIPYMYKYLDYVHVMCYDYHGKWDRKAGHNAPLYGRPDETPQDRVLNVDYTINYLIKKGGDRKKTVLGVPFYGRAFALLNPHDHGIGSKTKATSFNGPYTREDGFMGYNEICEELDEEEEPWEIVWDEYYKAPYMFKKEKWVSYDDEKSLRVKAEYAHDNNLAGVMTWSIDTDDFRGNCKSHKGLKYPLLRVLNNALHKRSIGVTDSGSNIKPNVFFSTAIILINVFLLTRLL